MPNLTKTQQALIEYVADGYRETGEPVKTRLSGFKGKGFSEKTVSAVVGKGLIDSVKVTGDEFTFAGVAQRNGYCYLKPGA